LSSDIIQIELGGFFCSDHFVARDDDNGFTEVIYYNKQGVRVMGFRKVGYKVHGDGFSYTTSANNMSST
jgi:hypothetical protein